MHVAAAFRYPVKSLQGESRRELDVTAGGVAGDRGWAVVDLDGKIGSGKSSRRFRAMPGLLDLAAALPDGVPVLRLPDGRALRVDDPAAAAAVGALIGRPVRLAAAGATPYVDAAPVHLLTTASLAALGAALPDAAVDVRRFRPNLLIGAPGADWVEDAWVGRVVEVGEVRLAVRGRTERCAMVGLAQPGLQHDPRVLQTVAQAHHLDLGVYADVLRPGPVRVGDPVRLADD